jgi:hypothetical protein
MLLTFYRVSARRGSLLANVAGIVVHDHWHPYYTLKGVLHALCNAHHQRELKARVEIEKKDWARRMQRLRSLPPRRRGAGLTCGQSRIRAGRAAQAGTDRADRAVLRPHRCRRTGLP